MWRVLSTCIVAFSLLAGTYAQDCASVRIDLKLPAKIKTRGKPKVAKWEEVDKLLNSLHGRLQGLNCSFRYDEVFRLGKEKDEDRFFFPLTNSVVRLVQEEPLMDSNVYSRKGELLGTFAGKIRFEKSGNLYAKKSYTVYYFQYKTPGGRLQSVGSELLLDRFLLKWVEIKNKIAISTEGVD